MISPDYFLAHKPSQPKKEVIDFAEKQGIPVPRRFNDLQNALSSGRDFVIRSEHPQDYEGVSGLLKSLYVTAKEVASASVRSQKEIDWTFVSNYRGGNIEPLQEAENYLVANVDVLPQATVERRLRSLSNQKIEWHCNLLGLDFNAFAGDISYSYWERLSGINRSVVADSAIEGRYHIFSQVPDNDYSWGYTVVEKDAMQYCGTEDLSPEADASLASIPKFYETVRHLEYFSATHCPLIEVQTVGIDHLLLQYLRTRDFQPPLFDLDREPDNEEMEAFLVRGATPKDGLVLKVNVRWMNATQQLSEEEAGLDCHYNEIYSQIMVMRRKLLIERAESMHEIGIKAQDDHLSKAKLFKPQISVVLKRRDWKSIIERVQPDSLEGFSIPHPVTVRVVSDGRRSFLKQLKLANATA